MQDLANEVGVSRATLFRWVGNRDALFAEILWSLAEPTLRKIVDSVSDRGGIRVARILGRFAADLLSADYFRAYLRREPERALRVLTTRAEDVQRRVVAAVEAILRQEVDEVGMRMPLPLHDLAYLLVRILESFIYTDLITGEEPDPANVEKAVRAVLHD